MAMLRDAIDRRKRADKPASWATCAELGNHIYQVVGKMMPTEIRCSTCTRTWVVAGPKAVD